MAEYLGFVVFEKADVHLFSRGERVVLNVVWDYADADFCPHTGYETNLTLFVDRLEDLPAKLKELERDYGQVCYGYAKKATLLPYLRELTTEILT
ncbi:MAG: hypothetical protein ACO2O5_07780 [Candidatus Caldipriscus sp.]|jgi:hypothetical protein